MNLQSDVEEEEEGSYAETGVVISADILGAHGGFEDERNVTDGETDY